MIKIIIAGQERRLEDASEQWITQQINGRRQDGLSVCVQVSILEGAINLLLSTPGCSAGGGGGTRTLNPQEHEVLDLWRHRGLSDLAFSSGNVVAFLKQIKRTFG